jgi:hypothetical protein
VGDGRGFVVEHRVRVPKIAKLKLRMRSFTEHFVVVTAAHCLPSLPPAYAASYVLDRTFKNLLASLDGSKGDVWAECLFVDPVADIAVLGRPDTHDLDEQSHAYEALLENTPILRIGKARNGPGWVLSLGGDWVPTRLELADSTGKTSLHIDPTEPGMSGSPILDNAGRAVGIVAIGGVTRTPNGDYKNERAGPQPILTDDLPGRLTQNGLRVKR